MSDIKTGNRKFKMAAIKLEYLYQLLDKQRRAITTVVVTSVRIFAWSSISWPPSFRRQDCNVVPMANPPFSGFRNSMELFLIRCYVTGSRKSKMAIVKPEVLISRLVDDSNAVPTTDSSIFWVQEFNCAIPNIARYKWKSEIQYGGRQTGNTSDYISQPLDKIRRKFKRLNLCFQGPGTQLHYGGYCTM